MMYMCIPCGYIYDEEKTGMLWSDLDDSWLCPECDGSSSNYAKFIMQKDQVDIDEIIRLYDI